MSFFYSKYKNGKCLNWWSLLLFKHLDVYTILLMYWFQFCNSNVWYTHPCTLSVCLLSLNEEGTFLKSWIAWSEFMYFYTAWKWLNTFFDTVLYTYIFSDQHALIFSGHITVNVNLRRQSSVFSFFCFHVNL